MHKTKYETIEFKNNFRNNYFKIQYMATAVPTDPTRLHNVKFIQCRYDSGK